MSQPHTHTLTHLHTPTYRYTATLYHHVFIHVTPISLITSNITRYSILPPHLFLRASTGGSCPRATRHLGKVDARSAQQQHHSLARPLSLASLSHIPWPHPFMSQWPSHWSCCCRWLVARTQLVRRCSRPRPAPASCRRAAPPAC